MTASSFDRESAWAERLGGVRDVVRQRLVTSQLLAHLTEPAPGQLVVDIGCGQGTQAIALARRGYQVVGVDPSAELLDLARDGLTAQPPLLRSYVTFEVGDLDSLADVVPTQPDVLLCHGVVMYLPSLEDSIEALAKRIAPGGLLSVLTRNQAGIAVRAGMQGRWEAAIDGFDRRSYANNLGIENVRADLPEEVIEACEAQGLDVLAWYGVRFFTDHWHHGETPDDLAALVEAERRAGERDPYRRVAVLTHVLARMPD